MSSGFEVCYDIATDESFQDDELGDGRGAAGASPECGVLRENVGLKLIPKFVH